jgi:hypothetical protein
MRNLLFFIPPEFAVLMIVGAGLAMIVGARALAGGLLVGALALVFLPVILAPIFELLPAWVLLGLLVCFGFGIARALLELAIGKRAAEHTVGILAADVIRYSVVAPFRLLGWLLRLFIRN